MVYSSDELDIALDVLDDMHSRDFPDPPILTNNSYKINFNSNQNCDEPPILTPHFPAQNFQDEYDQTLNQPLPFTNHYHNIENESLSNAFTELENFSNQSNIQWQLTQQQTMINFEAEWHMSQHLDMDF